MFKTKSKFLTVKDIQRVMKEGDFMPTTIFSAQKKDYIVKPRGTIFGSASKNKKGDFKL